MDEESPDYLPTVDVNLNASNDNFSKYLPPRISGPNAMASLK